MNCIEYTVLPYVNQRAYLKDSFTTDSFTIAESVAADFAETGDYTEIQIIESLEDEFTKVVKKEVLV